MGEEQLAVVPAATYTIGCRACQALNRVPGQASKFDCESCGRRNFVIGCDRCGGADVIAGSGRRMPTGWTCCWCLASVANVGVSRLRSRGGFTAADAWQSLDHHGLARGGPGVTVLGGFELVGGSGDCPPARTLCSIATLADGVLVVAEVGARGRTLLPYGELLELEVGGRGMISTGGGYGGGGIGIGGIVTGMAVASMLNNATRKTHVDSFLRVTTEHTQMLLRHWRYPPEQVRSTLSRMFAGQLAATRSAAAPAPVVIAAPAGKELPSGPIDELAQLTKLHAAGTLSDTEFEMARSKQIKRLRDPEES